MQQVLNSQNFNPIKNNNKILQLKKQRYDSKK